ncbi:alcohol dehydrogenase catalytic domain-containing protein [Dactylosporangium sp. AC04546]|uniref:zinc-dependent alcohol dehydrogenase n=1 Tax=Dactylosporangium sp. AC04546 TaxID=2862460 RepID=UPI001EDE778A|nr:alcohol dehydrogenase catalytic domain-containing protein [Dactylosporangium sp. AC04546]WVK79148.1 alcohol dehydrogenase catalytic domain-containing protein [Dactylosporangium sp. AC04546]
MRAAVLTGPGAVEVAGDWPEPECGPDDVVVAVRAVGVCGSDLAVVDGKRAVPSLPWALGHEAIGDIIRVGGNVPAGRLGERVAVEPNFPCLHCAACTSGRTAVCPDRRILGINEPGALRERVTVPARFAWTAPVGLADEDLVCVEPLAVALAALTRAGLAAGERCLVVGAGAQGLLVCLAAQALGARPFVVDPHEGRLATAAELGAAAMPAGPDVSMDFPVVFETSGVPVALETAVERCAPDGRIVLIGQSAVPARLSTFTVVQRRITLRGCLIYDHPADFAAAVARAAELRPGRILRGRFPLERAGDAFAQARKLPGKTWITLEEPSR